jgi:DNA-binding SARP family transcriptional activator
MPLTNPLGGSRTRGQYHESRAGRQVAARDAHLAGAASGHRDDESRCRGLRRGAAHESDRDAPAIAPGERALLGLLIVHRGTPISTDRIEDALWPEDPPASSSKIVQIYVSHLRRALGADVISRVAGGYRLDPVALGLDVVRFEATVSEGGRQLTAGDAAGALRLFDEALALAGAGEPFADLAYHEFVRNEVERLKELRWTALEGRFEAALALGRNRDVVAELQQAVRARNRSANVCGNH